MKKDLIERLLNDKLYFNKQPLIKRLGELGFDVREPSLTCGMRHLTEKSIYAIAARGQGYCDHLRTIHFTGPGNAHLVVVATQAHLLEQKLKRWIDTEVKMERERVAEQNRISDSNVNATEDFLSELKSLFGEKQDRVSRFNLKYAVNSDGSRKPVGIGFTIIINGSPAEIKRKYDAVLAIK